RHADAFTTQGVDDRRVGELVPGRRRRMRDERCEEDEVHAAALGLAPRALHRQPLCTNRCSRRTATRMGLAEARASAPTRPRRAENRRWFGESKAPLWSRTLASRVGFAPPNGAGRADALL